MSEMKNQPKLSTNALGFWIYLMTDCVLFATLFAAFALFRHSHHGSVSVGEDTSLPYVMIESVVLLLSSATTGIAVVKSKAGKSKKEVMSWLMGTYALGITFLYMELTEFAKLVSEGRSWKANASYSSYFTLVGTHGLHITIGLIWLLVLLLAFSRRNDTKHLGRKLELFGIYWHFLDVIWIFIFAIVYMLGAV